MSETIVKNPGKNYLAAARRRRLRAALQTARATAQAEHDEEWLFNLNEVFPND